MRPAAITQKMKILLNERESWQHCFCFLTTLNIVIFETLQSRLRTSGNSHLHFHTCKATAPFCSTSRVVKDGKCKVSQLLTLTEKDQEEIYFEKSQLTIFNSSWPWSSQINDKL